MVPAEGLNPRPSAYKTGAPMCDTSSSLGRFDQPRNVTQCWKERGFFRPVTPEVSAYARAHARLERRPGGTELGLVQTQASGRVSAQRYARSPGRPDH